MTQVDHPHNHPKRGDKRPLGDAERHHHVHQLHRDRHSHNRSSRRPYAEVLAQKCDQPLDESANDRSISNHSSEHGHNPSDSNSASECFSASDYPECYSPEPREKLKAQELQSLLLTIIDNNTVDPCTDRKTDTSALLFLQLHRYTWVC